MRCMPVAKKGLRRGRHPRPHPLHPPSSRLQTQSSIMTYTVKEIFFTLQGEGAHTGRPAVFLRFSGCNLWTGFERDRASAVCTFCDTDFVGVGPDGGKFATADALAAAVDNRWPTDAG